ncbi:hypothetical protein F4815DRAFT_278993 [Daldinia loculata]|nr:hypothetical protein F4815DRAFT_278993 [Daldinia loculata]
MVFTARNHTISHQMDPPASLDIHERWNEEKECMIAKHAKELAFHEDLLEKEKQDLRESSESDLLKLKAAVPPALYREIILPMAEKSLKNDIRQIEASHQKRTIIIEKEQKAERARHEIAYHEKLKVSLAINGDTNATAGVKGSLISQPQDSSLRNARHPRRKNIPLSDRASKHLSIPTKPLLAHP